MTKLISILSLLFLLSLLTMPQACYYDSEEELYGNNCDTTAVTYSGFIQPLLQSQCSPSCHSGAQPTGNLDFTQYTNVRTAALDGRLYAAVTRTTNWMPQNGTKLDDCTLNKINAWVKAGALNN